MTWNFFWDSVAGAITYLRLGYTCLPLCCFLQLHCLNKIPLVPRNLSLIHATFSFHICSLYLGSSNLLYLDLWFPQTSLRYLTDFSSVKPLCQLSSPGGGSFPYVPVWFRSFLPMVLRTFVLLSFFVVCSVVVKNWVWVRALPLTIWTTLASFLLLPTLSLSIKSDRQVPVLQGCWEGQWDRARKLLSSVSGTREAPSKHLAACHLKPILIFGGFPQVESWQDCIHLHGWKAGCNVPLPFRCGTWAPLTRCSSLRVYVLCPCTIWGGVRMSPVGLGSSKNSLFSTVAVETGPVTMSSPDLLCGGILAVVLLCGLS